MTSIEKLQLCGVRSFDPNPVNQQSIQFQKPLTVILGKNGAGKTTIIEALLNACTGAMPPGSGTEKGCFVYDPKVVSEVEVKAQIRLIFTGKGGKMMQVIRSFQATRSGNRISFTTLDNTIAFQDAATGEVVSSTYRASDVDRVVPEMLGVTSAVLEHVIFCHQEECNWPLGPPKDVKRIFDDIFAATRYVLALDRLRDNSKEFRRQLKEHEASLMALREHREQAKQLELQIEQKESVVKAIQSRSAGIEPELRDLRQASEKLKAVEEKIEAMQREVAVTKGRLEERRDAVRRIGISPTTQTLEELVEMRSSFASQMKQLERNIDEDAKRHDAETARRRGKEEEVYQCRSNIQLLEQEVHQHKRRVVRLRELMEPMSSEYVLGEDNVDERSLKRMLSKAEEVASVSRQHARSVLEASQQRIQGLEEEIQSGLRTLDGCSNEREMLEQALERVERRISDNSTAITSLGGDRCHVQLRQARAEVKELQERVEAVRELRKKGRGEQLCQRILKELEEQNSTVAQLRERMMQQKQRERQQQELQHLRQQLDETSTSVSDVVSREVLPKLHDVGVSFPANVDTATLTPQALSSLRLQAVEVHKMKIEELQKLQAEVLKLGKTCATQEQKLIYCSSELEECRRKVAAGLRDCAGHVEDINTYESQVMQAKQSAEVAAQKMHAAEALMTCYHEFMEVAKDDRRCAVCDRCFDTNEALQHFLDTNAERHRTSPEALREVQAAAVTAHNAYRQLEEVQQAVTEVRQHTQRIPALEKDIQTLTEQIATNKSEQRAADAAHNVTAESVRQLDAVCQSLTAVCGMAEKSVLLRESLAKRTRELSGNYLQQHSEENQTNDADGDAAAAETYDELSESYSAATDRLHRLNKQFTEAQREERGQEENAAERQLQERTAAMYQVEVSVSKLVDLEKASAELRGEAAMHRTRLEAIAQDSAKIQRTVEELKCRLQRLRSEFEKVEAAERSAVDLAENQLRQLQVAVPPVLSFIQSGGAKRLDELRAHLREVEQACATTVQEQEELAKRMEEARRTLGDQYRRSVEMDRHIDALQQKASITADEAHLGEAERALARLLSERLSGVEQLLGEEAKHSSLSELRDMIAAKVTSLEKIRAQQDGNMEAMLLDVNQLRQQLRGSKYQNIEKRYRSTFLKVQTTEISIGDIEKYYSALEKAVQSYHQEKIAQINQLIAELWRQTYRGSDIDSVEIRSESEGTSTTSARRSYNYRVVMKRGNNELDMRGRCSAGQKVLASIIIRLALSEAFCCDCGILALDEPTTNLDDDNARSLADALRTLIEVRRAVKHFQLVVITHDEQFVRALGGQSLDKFYYVHKDREGAFSVIDERTFDQLFA